MSAVVTQPPTFATRLRVLRRAAGLSQAKLAELAGLHRQAIARLESGDNRPTWETVVSLARALGKTPNDFLADEG